MKYLVLIAISITTLLSCSKNCSHCAEDKLTQWTEAKPVHYAYTIERSSFTSLEYLGPYRFEILNDEIDTVYFDLDSFQGETEDLFEGWDNYESVLSFTMNSRIEDIFASIVDFERACDATYDDTFHYPTLFDIKSDPEIADSGARVRILNFKVF